MILQGLHHSAVNLINIIALDDISLEYSSVDLSAMTRPSLPSTRFVVSDDVALLLAQQLPHSTDSFPSLRGMPSRIAMKAGKRPIFASGRAMYCKAIKRNGKIAEYGMQTPPIQQRDMM